MAELLTKPKEDRVEGFLHTIEDGQKRRDCSEIHWIMTKAANYLAPGFERHKILMKKPGKHATSKSCLYIKRLADVDVNVQHELDSESVLTMRKTTP